MMDVLIKRYGDRRKLYLSGTLRHGTFQNILSLASMLTIRRFHVTAAPLIETAPVPAGAQFLNVIESVFSGMARAIIHKTAIIGLWISQRRRLIDTSKIGMLI